jgi:hypothetical protein
MGFAAGELIVCSSFKPSAAKRFSHSTPLLEEERNFGLLALISDGGDPFSFHCPGAWTAFASNNHPIDVG